jgi:tRNA(Ile)-lysidine synthetase-like protein
MASTAHRLNLEARRHHLVTELARRLFGRCQVAVGARVVVGVSGGPDSLALLLGAIALRERRTRSKRPVLEPIACHVNHHLREDADDDEAFVTDLCRKFHVPLWVQHVRPDELPGNVAANARELRYEALDYVGTESGAAHVAVAHHAQDQLETMLIALGRGHGIDALAGMSWTETLAFCSDGPLDRPVTVVRPLLQVSKSSCESMCEAAGIRWRVDPTNTDPATIRGRLRRDVIGGLEALWPSAALGASLAADDVSAARAALDRLLEETFGKGDTVRWDRATLRALPVPVIAAGLRRASESVVPVFAAPCGRVHVMPVAEAIRDDERRPRTWDWPYGLRVRVTASEVILDRAG